MSPKNSSWWTKDLQLLACTTFVAILLQLMGSVVGYEIYYMDHQVTEKQARDAIDKAYNYTQEVGKPIWCGPCTDDIESYCTGTGLIKDHCCCDQGHEKEDLPWVPHSCYMGKEICKPIAKSCLDYMHRRQCCCDKILAEMLHSELSAAIGTRPFLLLIIIISAVMMLVAVRRNVEDLRALRGT